MNHEVKYGSKRSWTGAAFLTNRHICYPRYVARLVNKLLKSIALLLLALWLPATLHCSLEAAGLEFEGHEEHASASATGAACHDDACDVVEGGSYVKALASLRAMPPALFVNAGLLLASVSGPVDEVVTDVWREAPAEVRVLQCCWSFVRRTALPARAPDAVA